VDVRVEGHIAFGGAAREVWDYLVQIYHLFCNGKLVVKMKEGYNA
jgi:hypothetical protein